MREVVVLLALFFLALFLVGGLAYWGEKNIDEPCRARGGVPTRVGCLDPAALR